MTMIAMLAMGGCSSYAPKTVDNKKTIEKDYVVTDASGRYRPTWIEDVNYWAKEEKKDMATYKYFSYEGAPKMDRELACDVAKASLSADIASSIQTKVEKSLDSFEESGKTALSQGGFVRSYVDRKLKSQIAQKLVGVTVENTYWEKRSFSVKRGAAQDGIGFTCAVLGRIQQKNLELAVDKAFNELYASREGAQDKKAIQEAVKEALNSL